MAEVNAVNVPTEEMFFYSVEPLVKKTCTLIRLFTHLGCKQKDQKRKRSFAHFFCVKHKYFIESKQRRPGFDSGGGRGHHNLTALVEPLK